MGTGLKKRTQTVSPQDRAIFRAWNNGESFQEIAANLGIDKATVSRALNRCRTAIGRALVKDHQRLRERQVSLYERAIGECLDAIEKSKDDEITITTQTSDKNGETHIERRKGRYVDPALLIVLDKLLCGQGRAAGLIDVNRASGAYSQSVSQTNLIVTKDVHLLDDSTLHKLRQVAASAAALTTPVIETADYNVNHDE